MMALRNSRIVRTTNPLSLIPGIGVRAGLAITGEISSRIAVGKMASGWEGI